jgi:hypothetical protein
MLMDWRMAMLNEVQVTEAAANAQIEMERQETAQVAA